MGHEASEAMGVRLVLVFRNRILTLRYSAVGGEAHNSPMLDERVRALINDTFTETTAQ